MDVVLYVNLLKNYQTVYNMHTVVFYIQIVDTCPNQNVRLKDAFAFICKNNKNELNVDLL